MTTVQNQDKTRIAVIGVGQIGKVHLQNYRAVANAEIVAIADSDEAEARRVADHFNIPSFYGDAHSLLARDDIDAVDICLHNNLHMPYTVAALKAGKHVYCEKPMAGSYRDAKAMLDEARKQGKMLSIQLSTLFSRETRAAKVLIDGATWRCNSTFDGYRRRGRPRGCTHAVRQENPLQRRPVAWRTHCQSYVATESRHSGVPIRTEIDARVRGGTMSRNSPSALSDSRCV